MNKQINFRVEAEPLTGYHDVATKREAERLVEEIKRHCDVNSAYVIYDIVCEFCESDWKSSLDENGCPICCQEALKEWEANKNKAKV